ncbi:hypothetical protein ADICYQ_4467 [Cyclobacterium qasimii M12-11B]|uniref:Uncharacterized protein n=1 Tax=Cyclobacterium qasimii M12-11B TaxID=641524 RepID=S7V8F7_9BACT|nr:hypothetical protein ADICYQ_4467 [Cyclobacterium qasimii M12-11B]
MVNMDKIEFKKDRHDLFGSLDNLNSYRNYDKRQNFTGWTNRLSGRVHHQSACF